MEVHRIGPLICWAWSVQKGGNQPSENEDAYHLAEEEGSALLAISDGSTEGIYSGLWARTLVAAARTEWLSLDDKALNCALDRVGKQFSPLDTDRWYVRNKFLLQGSQATLLVTKVETAEGQGSAVTVHAFAVGDSCLIRISPKGKIESFPISQARDFGSHPGLVRNRPPQSFTLHRYKGLFAPGDFLLLATDAVGQWIVSGSEAKEGLKIRGMFDRIRRSQDGFTEWVEEARSSQGMKNDDATLILCALARPRRGRRSL